MRIRANLGAPMRRTETIWDEDLNNFKPLGKRTLDEWEGDWTSTELKDMTGREFKPGDWVCKSYKSGQCTNLEIRKVREIKDGKLYLSESRVPVVYPGRMLILKGWEPPCDSDVR